MSDAYELGWLQQTIRSAVSALREAKARKDWGHVDAVANELGRQLQRETLSELRWVSCEACGGSGEIIRGQAPDESNELCAACEGTGRDCVEVSPIECADFHNSPVSR